MILRNLKIVIPEKIDAFSGFMLCLLCAFFGFLIGFSGGLLNAKWLCYVGYIIVVLSLLGGSYFWVGNLLNNFKGTFDLFNKIWRDIKNIRKKK